MLRTLAVQTVTLLCAAAFALAAAPGERQFQIATFSADVTIPIGHACMGGGISPAKEIVDPLLAKGLVLLGAEHPVVTVAVDWCEIRNDAYDRWRQVLAEAAGTTPRHVMLASVHQHDAPVCDLAAQKMLDAVGLKNSLCDPEFHERAVQRVAAAVRDALKSPRRITHFGIGQAEVEQVASNRRVVFPDGRVAWARTSATASKQLRDMPVGSIDPMLKTLSFWNGDQPVAAISAYSVHPMSYYGQGGVSWDFPGMARERRQKDNPAVFQIYLSGCSGDTIAGKYNDGARGNRPILADRLYQGMVRAWEATVRHPLAEVSYRVTPLQLVPRYTVAELRERLNNSSLRSFERNLAAMGLSWHQRVAAGQPVDVPALDLGRARLLFLPAESFVAYQLMAQRVQPEAFVLVAGFAECAPGYIPIDRDFEEGFTDSWCWILPKSEQAMTNAIRKALAP